MKTFTLMISAIGLAVAVVLSGCSGAEFGTMELSVTDAPIVDADSVTGVYVTFEGVEYNRDDQWETMTGFDGPQTVDLLELTGGNSQLLGQLTLPAGEYTQIRFMVAAMNEGSTMPSNTGTWINRDDNSTYDSAVDDPLFVPSGAQTGYKAHAKEPFSVPIGGSVQITADFDLRKAIVETGNTGNYILKPTLRLVVENQAGSISGTVTNSTGDELVVFAYEDGAFDASEASDPADGESQFPNAVVSANVEDSDGDGTLDYTVAFLPAGDYDLVVAQYDSTTGDYVASSGDAIDVENVTVESGQTTPQNISL